MSNRYPQITELIAKNISANSHVLAFSGHRMLADPQSIAETIESAFDHIISSCKQATSITAVSSIAAGSDVLFCEAALRLNLPINIVLPFPEAEFRKDFVGPFETWWPNAESILRKARDRKALFTLEEPYSRETAYLDCGKTCVDVADQLLAVVDSQSARSKVGTHAIVEYARSNAKPVLSINPDTCRIDWRNA